CWVHMTANVLAKLPKSRQPKAKRALQEIWMAETKAVAELAFHTFIESHAKVREGGRLLEPRSRRAARLLRRPGRVLETPPNHQSHRKHLRHRAPSHVPKACLSNRTASRRS